MVKIVKVIITDVISRIKAIREVYWLLTGAGLFATILVVSFYPQHLTFAYDSATCTDRIHFVPGLVSADTREFKMSSTSVMKIAGAEVAAGGFCFIPDKAPQPGDYTFKLAFAPLPFIYKTVSIHVPDPPKVMEKQLEQPIPLTKKITIQLNQSDKIFTYRLIINEKSTYCSPQTGTITCDISKLGLLQGEKYTLKLDRYFKDAKVDTVLTKNITTLSAVSLKSSSINEGEVVYAKPTSATLQFNKRISSAVVSLLQASEGKKQIIVKQFIKDDTLILTWTGDLERQRSFELLLQEVIASDGSALAQPITIHFTVSGGPKVKSISVGTYKVPLGSMATLTFDQPLADNQDVSSSITITGGAKIVGRQASSVTISFADVPRCGAVTIKVGNALKSSYGIIGGSSWTYSTRTICQSVFSIGTSVVGRAIYGYSFGSGSKVVVYTGAIHGDEVSTRSLMLRWIDALEAAPNSIPADKRVVVIPTINPDGYASGIRTNAHNVDLNRNFDTSDWQSDITTVTNKPFPGGGGPAPLSEPESSAIASYIAAVHPVLVLSYHSIGGLVIANQTGNSSQLASRYASLSGYANSTGSSGTFDYAISGTADDYYAQRLGVASLVIELGSHTYHQFDRNQSAMWAMVRET